MSAAARLPSALEVSTLVRRVQAAGGFAAVLARGDADSGAILLVLAENGQNQRAYERMPSPDGGRVWHQAFADESPRGEAMAAWLERRRQRDGDLWIVELDIAEGERFIVM